MQKIGKNKLLIKNDPIVIKEKNLLNQKLRIYLFGVMDDDSKASSYYTLLKYLMFKSEIRSDALLKINTSFSGEIILGMPDSKTDRLNILQGQQ